MEHIAGSLFAEPSASLRLMVDQEFELRRAEAQMVEPAEMLALSARVLELNLVFAGINEAVHETGAKTVSQAVAQIARIMTLASTITRLDLSRVFKENANILPKMPERWTPHSDHPAAVSVDVVVRSVRSLLAYCPIERLEDVAESTGITDLGHRCRIAYDGLAAFSRRNDPRNSTAARTVGRAYAEGRLSLVEVCSVLDASPSDAAAFLQDQGFCRSPNVIPLGDAERKDILSKARQDRLARRGKPAANLVSRDVIASQRIEGVDARPWIPRG